MCDSMIYRSNERIVNNIKIAVAADGEVVTEHFGHCEGFVICTVEAKQIIESEFVANPGHRPGFLPNFLHSKHVDVIISGGMGPGAIEIFNAKNIGVVTGVEGNARTVVKDYLDGKLRISDNICHEH